MAKKIPEIGKRVVVYDHQLEKELRGPVNWCGSIQFTFLPEGHDVPRFCFYANQWRYEEDGAD